MSVVRQLLKPTGKICCHGPNAPAMFSSNILIMASSVLWLWEFMPCLGAQTQGNLNLCSWNLSIKTETCLDLRKTSIYFMIDGLLKLWNLKMSLYRHGGNSEESWQLFPKNNLTGLSNHQNHVSLPGSENFYWLFLQASIILTPEPWFAISPTVAVYMYVWCVWCDECVAYAWVVCVCMACVHGVCMVYGVHGACTQYLSILLLFIQNCSQWQNHFLWWNCEWGTISKKAPKTLQEWLTVLGSKWCFLGYNMIKVSRTDTGNSTERGREQPRRQCVSLKIFRKSSVGIACH
jgi:hypothetical protein